MLVGDEGKMTEKAIRWREKALRKQGLSARDIALERLRLEARKGERAGIRAEAAAYRQRWLDILDLERAREMQEIRERLKSPVDRLIEDGLAFDGLQAYWQDDSRRHFGKRVAVFKLSGAQELPRSHFKIGDKVTIVPSALASQAAGDVESADDASASMSADAAETVDAAAAMAELAWDEHRIEAEIVDKQKTYLRLKFDEELEKTDLVGCPSWRLDHGYNDLTYERMQAAMEAIDHDVEFVESRGGTKYQNILSGTRLNDLILGVDPPGDRTTRGAFWEDARIQSWYDRYSRSDPLVIDGDPDLGLNASQTKAIATMLKERISLVQGPPGTGKTRTIVQAIKLLKHEFQVPHPILLAAHTNVAVDNLAEGCIRAGLKVVRVGPSSRARTSIANATLDAYFIRHPLKARLDDMKRRMDALERQKGALDAANRSRDAAGDVSDLDGWDALADATAGALPTSGETPEQQLGKLKRTYYFLRSTIRGQILNGADVICGSAIAAGSPELDTIDFPVVFFDEGSMATEPISLVPLMKGCRHLSIIGDHKQLPPVVTSADAKEAGLSRSLFERLIENREKRKPVSSTMLDVQFRMHPSIADYPVATFYGGALASGESTHAIEPVQSTFLPCHRDAVGAADAGKGSGRDEVAARYLGFVHHTGHESKADNHSLQNHSESRLLLEILVDLLARNPSLRGSDIGIVTPYLGQQILLEKMLQVEASPQRRRAVALLKGNVGRASELGDVDIHTVDGFEGREKRVILFSTVRTNPAGYVGFLADGRRLNVALTRAQSCLLVVGSVQTLRNAKISESAASRISGSGGGGAGNVDSPNVEALRGYAEYVEAKGLVVDAEERVRELKLQRGEITAEEARVEQVEEEEQGGGGDDEHQPQEATFAEADAGSGSFEDQPSWEDLTHEQRL
ncbi:uncharacterized protein PFL1_01814 [Pseudozyma flocculosa PF-1]|nr:uncharacterized protein PFL1_01814 [Pseudozyma flocculosa PF-1]EPQ30916.1 hypothetical protein PFL1_01814 [Pseudozyma flocculosa PF-1]